MVVMPVSSVTPGCCASHARMRRILGLLSIVFSHTASSSAVSGHSTRRVGGEVLLREREQARELVVVWHEAGAALELLHVGVEVGLHHYHFGWGAFFLVAGSDEVG